METNKSTTIENITDEQIEALREEAKRHGDLEMASVCTHALDGLIGFRAECVRVISEAEDA